MTRHRVFPDGSADRLRAVVRRLRETRGLFGYAALRFYNDNCFQTAASLTYTTLLAIVPLMTIGFAIFTAFPAFGDLQLQVQEIIFRNLVPEIGDAVLDYLYRFTANAGQMTVFGVIGLALSAILLIWTIEGAFAAIWRVHEPRSLITRILSFWAIVSLSPLFAGASLSLSTSLWNALAFMNMPELTHPLLGLTGLLPFLVQAVGCMLLYLVVPNRPVNWGDAAFGALAASLVLEISKAAFGWYLRTYPAYQTIYGALSTIPIFLFWLYIAWSTVLFGAVVTAALPEWRAGKITRGGPEGLLPAQRLALALAVLHELMAASRLGVGLRRRTLVHRVPVGAVLIDGILQQLREAHWTAYTTRDSWVVTRDLGEATLFDLLKALGVGLRGSVRSVGGLEHPWLERAGQLIDAAEANQQEILAVPLKRLFEDVESAAAAAEPVLLRAQRRGP